MRPRLLTILVRTTPVNVGLLVAFLAALSAHCVSGSFSAQLRASEVFLRADSALRRPGEPLRLALSPAAAQPQSPVSAVPGFRPWSWPQSVAVPERDWAVARVGAAAPGELFGLWSVDRVATAGPLSGPARFQTRCRVIVRATLACAVVIRGSPTMRGSPNTVSPAGKSATSSDRRTKACTSMGDCPDGCPR
jgi:hypothetical protein